MVDRRGSPLSYASLSFSLVGGVQEDLEALVCAQRDAADSARVLSSERAWVRSLDQMRLDDLTTITQLEKRLHQWAIWHPSALDDGVGVGGGIGQPPVAGMVSRGGGGGGTTPRGGAAGGPLPPGGASPRASAAAGAVFGAAAGGFTPGSLPRRTPPRRLV